MNPQRISHRDPIAAALIPLVLGVVLALVGCGGGYGSSSYGGSGGGYMGGASGPTITMQPASISVSAGQTASFQVMATGTGTLSYQWMKNSVDVTGATAATYTTPAVSSADNNAQFAVKVTDSYGTTTSSHAILTVL